ncbi:MAG: acetyl-CoA carboxylase biotin carboxylase subunit [Candidatus Kapabacteria bacterium]|nr:acetyl-CoA carboxylase biotin carboxylase subunit [Candidatus Kapabacteria bacterium]
MFDKILVANRGEIAIRVMHAAHDLGVEAVAIYHEVDKEMPYIRHADFAYQIHGATPKAAYLDIEQIISIALKSGAKAIHPGYGFLSENSAFSAACAFAGIEFIGPPAHAIEVMGSKTRARQLMAAAGVPIVPGTTEKITDINRAFGIAEGIGYPILLKASAGGGGKGMRRVYSPDELINNFEAAQRESLKSFGDDSIYIEKLVENPKHIEIQIIGDKYGNFVHLGERDCSIQRRHQKVIEEAPSTVLDAEIRAKMGEVAINAAKACNYVNAGTIEFLFDKNRNFYFLEMNTRLQVEHPITEAVTGIDLAREQIRIAAGEKLSFTQSDIVWRGHAIECRINAEDPYNNFMPDTGKIKYLREPAGKGVRVDSGVESGTEVSVHFDSMLAKLIVYANSRDEAVNLMKRALKSYNVKGIKTIIPFLSVVMNHPVYQSGNFDTGFIENDFDFDSFKNDNREHEEAMAAISAYIFRLSKENSIPKRLSKNKCSKWDLKKFG